MIGQGWYYLRHRAEVDEFLRSTQAKADAFRREMEDKYGTREVIERFKARVAARKRAEAQEADAALRDPCTA